MFDYIINCINMISCACITTPWPCRCVRCFTAADGDASCDARAQNLGSHPRGAELWGMGCYGSKCGHPKIRKVQKIQRPLPLIVTHNQSIPKMFGGSVYHLRPCVFFCHKFAHKYGSSISRERVLLEFQP